MDLRFLLIMMFTVLSLTVNSFANDECVSQKSNLRKTQHVKVESFGSVAFSQNSNPARLTKASGVICIVLKGRKRVYFWVNHKGNFNGSKQTFLAVQIVKTFEDSDKFQFIHKTHGSRKGTWIRENEKLVEIPKVKPFGTMEPIEFVQLHGSPENLSENGKLDDHLLIEKFKNQFWHASPEGTKTSSLEWPEYWSDSIESDKNIQIENLLIRFKTIPKDDWPTEFKNGIPFDTGWPPGMESMEVRIFSPISSEFAHRITLQLK